MRLWRAWRERRQSREDCERGVVVGTGASVVIVGAGVSGCACGAVLAAAGVEVTLVSGALDLVGLPSYGPEVWVGSDCMERCVEALDGLPSVLRDVWVDACVVAEGLASCVVVDRRRLSVETKRALEGFRGLRFRQGLVVELRAGSARAGLAADAFVGGVAPQGEALELETAFGEVLCADVVVLATGLSLGGRVVVGEQEMVGGRYGETPSDRLMESLTALGAEWAEATETVGARWGAAEVDADEVEVTRVASPRNVGSACVVTADALPLRWALSRAGGEERARCGDGQCVANEEEAKWASDLPPSPYFGTVEGRAPFQAWGACAKGLGSGGVGCCTRRSCHRRGLRCARGDRSGGIVVRWAREPPCAIHQGSGYQERRRRRAFCWPRRWRRQAMGCRKSGRRGRAMPRACGRVSGWVVSLSRNFVPGAERDGLPGEHFGV